MSLNEIKVVGRNEVSYKNKKLQNATMHVYSIGENIRQKWFEIGAIIAQVDAGEFYKEDGFASVHEWVAQAFGLKKSRSYDLLRIGKEYTREVMSKAGKVIGYECNLLPETTSDNFTTTQVTRLLPLGYEVAAELVDTGEIAPDMTVKQITDVVKSHMPHEDKPESTDERGDAMEKCAEEDAKASHEEWLRQVLDAITTDELIAEIVRRGYIVHDFDGADLTSKYKEKGGEM